jgi:hypothetical protein
MTVSHNDDPAFHPLSTNPSPEKASSKPKVIVPSFSTSSVLFAQHLNLLKELRENIDKLRNTYEQQRDETASWKALKSIMGVLDSACSFLDFPLKDA